MTVRDIGERGRIAQCHAFAGNEPIILIALQGCRSWKRHYVHAAVTRLKLRSSVTVIQVSAYAAAAATLALVMILVGSLNCPCERVQVE